MTARIKVYGRAFIESFAGTAPILRRELLGLLRSKRAWAITFLSVAGSSLIPLLIWPEAEESMA